MLRDRICGTVSDSGRVRDHYMPVFSERPAHLEIGGSGTGRRSRKYTLIKWKESMSYFVENTQSEKCKNKSPIGKVCDMIVKIVI